MSEWKRVFGNGQRMGSLAVLTLLSLVLFGVSLVWIAGEGAIQRTVDMAGYHMELVRDLQGRTCEEMRRILDDKENRLIEFEEWYASYYEDHDPGMDYNEEERAARDLIADQPSAVQASGLGLHRFEYTYAAFWDVLLDLGEQVDYVDSYPAYLEKIQIQASQQSQTSIFGAENSYSRRNLRKTAEDFAAIGDVEAQIGNNRGIEAWMAFELGDYFQLAGMVIFVLALLEERKKGLWSIVRACGQGRLPLALTRAGILAVAAALCTLLFCGLPLFVSLCLSGGWQDMGRPVQSLMSFRTCTLRVTIAEWLGRYFLIKVAVGWVIGLFFWALLGSLANIQFSLGVLGAVLAGEYAFSELIPTQSALSPLKFFNLFSYIHTSVLDTRYVNMNLFGYPVGAGELLLAALPVFAVSFLLWALSVGCLRRPEGNRDLLGSLSVYGNRAADLVRCRLSLGGWEFYKTFVFQFGALMLPVMMALSQKLEYTVFIGHTDTWYQAYAGDIEGPLGDTDAYLDIARGYAADAIDAGELHGALDRLEARVDELRERAAEKGYEPWMMDASLYKYKAYYSHDSILRQRLNAAIAVAFVVFGCAGLTAGEKQAGMVCLLRAQKRGRRPLYVRKAVMATLMAVLVFGMVWLREWRTFVDYAGPLTLDAPVGNVDLLADFPWSITFRQYFLLLYGLRLFMLMATAWVTLFFSGLAGGLPSAYALCLSVLSVPGFLLAFGAEALKWISPVVPAASAELLWSMGRGSVIPALPWLIWLLMGTAALWAGGRRWSGKDL
ncbi:MAG: hypothetical protein HFI38_06375 [Lachnospiraceae bacterium]|jgi:hypothetical protein|nr:hypothetical protein [Lachnospiraceae bacterium]